MISQPLSLSLLRALVFDETYSKDVALSSTSDGLVSGNIEVLQIKKGKAKGKRAKKGTVPSTERGGGGGGWEGGETNLILSDISHEADNSVSLVDQPSENAGGICSRAKTGAEGRIRRVSTKKRGGEETLVFSFPLPPLGRWERKLTKSSRVSEQDSSLGSRSDRHS